MNDRYSITEIKTKSGATRFQLSGYDSKGKQHRKRFKAIQEAEGEQHRLEMADSRVEHNSHIVQTRLTPSEVREAERCFEMLPKGVSLTDAVERLVGAWNEGEQPCSMIDAMNEHLDAMRDRGCSERSVKSVEGKIKRFNEAGWAEVPIDQVTQNDASDWLDSLSTGNFKSHRLALSGLWTYAVEKKWCKVNIISEISIPDAIKKKKKGKVSVLSVEQCAAMLKAAHADGKTLAWTAVAIFAGLRPESELQRLTWADVDFRANNLHADEDSKTGHRVIEMHPTLKAWLQLATGQDFKQSRAALKHVKRAAGYKSGLTRKEGGKDWKADKDLADYPQDITRHTYGSNLFGRELCYNKTADQMGNSVPIVKRNYKRSLPSEQVERFWNLTPEEVLGKKALEVAG